MKSEYLIIISTTITIVFCIGIFAYLLKKKKGNIGLYISIIGIFLSAFFNLVTSQKAINTLADLVYSPQSDSGLATQQIDYIDSNQIPMEESSSTNNYSQNEENQIPDDNTTDWVVKNRNDVIYKDDIFVVQLFVRKAGSKEWKKSIEADLGEIIEFQVEYRNTTGDSNPVMVRASIPTNMEYIDNSTFLYNSSHQDGIAYLDCLSGVNIGSYQRNGNAYVRFKTVIIDNNLAEGNNRLITWVKITSNNEALINSADVLVAK